MQLLKIFNFPQVTGDLNISANNINIQGSKVVANNATIKSDNLNIAAVQDSKATQDQIRGGGRILSVIVPAGTAGKIVKGIKEAKALRKFDKLIIPFGGFIEVMPVGTFSSANLSAIC
jgi:hypothetical protein